MSYITFSCMALGLCRHFHIPRFFSEVSLESFIFYIRLAINVFKSDNTTKENRTISCTSIYLISTQLNTFWQNNSLKYKVHNKYLSPIMFCSNIKSFCEKSFYNIIQGRKEKTPAELYFLRKWKHLFSVICRGRPGTTFLYLFRHLSRVVACSCHMWDEVLCFREVRWFTLGILVCPLNSLSRLAIIGWIYLEGPLNFNNKINNNGKCKLPWKINYNSITPATLIFMSDRRHFRIFSFRFFFLDPVWKLCI